MVKNQLREVEKNLRWIAKRNRNISFSIGLVLVYVMLGINAFAQGMNATVATKQEIGLSTDRLSEMLRRIKEENSKKLKGTQLELVQLMEQGDQVVKSPWASWQFGLNYMYNNWRGSYKGRGDKAKKYPYEGIFTRSNDLFLRVVSPDSNAYKEYTAASTEKFIHPATTSAIKKQRKSYGLEDTKIIYEPIVTIELGASVKPKDVVKNSISITSPTIVINPPTILNTPKSPNAPNPPQIAITPFNPVAPDPITVSLPTPPTFNIKLGSFCNYMTPNCDHRGRDGGPHSGNPKSYDHNNNIDLNSIELTNGNPAIRYAWSSDSGSFLGANGFDSALLKVYFDYGIAKSPFNFNGGGTANIITNLTIDSINTTQKNDSAVINNQMFLVGGSRIATMDNAKNATIKNSATMNLVGPLVVGFEIQSDTNNNGVQGKREIENVGTITDAEENGYRVDKGWMGGLKLETITDGISDKPISSNEYEVELILPNYVTRNDPNYPKKLKITRTPEIIKNGIITTKGGFTGYKIGMILTFENNDERSTSDYRFINRGTIKFTGKNSTGIQIYAPQSPKTHITVENSGKIELGGIESYGLKLSSRVSEENMTFANTNYGIIDITGNNGNADSLSSGVAILEDSALTNTSAIRSYKNKVKNSGTINVSGGQGNTGMVMILKSDDNITNDTNGTISVSGIKNIGMRVDLGTVNTDDTGSLTPEAINKGSINITSGSENIGMVAQKADSSNHAVATNEKNIKLSNVSKGIGMFSQEGAKIVNKNNAEIEGNTGLSGVVGMVVNDTTSSGENQGTISLQGNRVTGVYNNLGTFSMTDGSISISGEKSITLYAKDSSNTNSKTKITKGSIEAKDKALGLFADNASIELGGAGEVKLKGFGAGTLLFYNYTGTNSNGRFVLKDNITGALTEGATSFYFKDITPSSGAGSTTAAKLNEMFGGSTKKLKLSLDGKSTLFVIDNTNKNTTSVPLSSVDPDQINNFIGDHVEIDSNSKTFKAYKTSKGTLSINTDVNLDHTEAPNLDKYYRVDFINSDVTVESGKKIIGTDTAKIKEAIAQANYVGATSNSDTKVINKGIIDFSKKGVTAIAVDYAQGINEGIIKMDAANGDNENSVALFGASNSKLINEQSGAMELGENGVGIWGANKITSSLATWGKNIDITNSGTIKGISGKAGIFGIYAKNDVATHAGATSKITHSGDIDLSRNAKSTGIYMTNGTLNSSGSISLKESSIGVNATDSTVNITAGTHTIGDKSAAFKLSGTTGNTSKFLGTGGNISITGKDSAVYLLNGVNFISGTNFTDKLTLTSTNPYTYINAERSTLNYKNTKTITNDETIFMNINNTNLTLESGTDISSTNRKVTGVYSTNGSITLNKGKISLTGDSSVALYGAYDGHNSASITNESTGDIEVGKHGIGVYVVKHIGINKGKIKVGENSVAMRTELGEGELKNEVGATIISTEKKALGMSQDGKNNGGKNILNEGSITLTGDQSVGMHSEKVTTANHEVKNTGTITIGDSTSPANPSIGIYSANGSNSAAVNDGKVAVGKQSIGIYGGNINSGVNSEIYAGDGGVGIYSKEGTVKIEDGAKLLIGKSLGKGKEGVVTYLAGNNQTLESKTSNMLIGDGSFGYVMTGDGNTITTGYSGNSGVVSLGKDSVFIYSKDKSDTGTIKNYNHLVSTRDGNYGMYVSGKAENHGKIDFSNGIGNVGIYSYLEGTTSTPKLVTNHGEINVSKSDLLTNPDDPKYGIGMAAGYVVEEPKHSGIRVTKGLGNIENRGTIRVTTPDSIGMYAGGAGSKAINYGKIELSGPKRNIGMFIEEGAEGINEETGIITTVGSNNKGQIGIAVMRGGILTNKGKIHIDATDGIGIFLAGAIVKNYGSFVLDKYDDSNKAAVDSTLQLDKVTVSGNAKKLKVVSATDTSKELGAALDHIKMKVTPGAPEATITRNGILQNPVTAQIINIPNKKPNNIPTSSIGMYIDTSGINYTAPITNIGHLSSLREADLILGTEATKYTQSKDIQLSQEMIKPYNEMIRTSGIEKWSIYSSSLTWMGTVTQKADFTIQNAYLSKIPYTVFVGDKNTTRDTYNFADGLEQRYGIEGLNSREKQVFEKLNSIG
ncbi:autotransporter-associated N-terminal domain-containing protein, partial [Fusobacterium necrophorum]